MTAKAPTPAPKGRKPEPTTAPPPKSVKIPINVELTVKVKNDWKEYIEDTQWTTVDGRKLDPKDMETPHLKACVIIMDTRFRNKREWLRLQLYKSLLFGLDTDKDYAKEVIDEAIRESDKWSLPQMLCKVVPLYKLMVDELVSREVQPPLPGIFS